MGGVLARANPWFENGTIRLLNLQEQWIVVFPIGSAQRDPAMSADASDSHNLASDIDDLEPLEKKPLVLLECFLVTIKHRVNSVIGRDIR